MSAVGHSGGAETQYVERKSLRLVTGDRANLRDLAATCVCFANGAGGRILGGIEDGMDHPPSEQQIDQALPDRLRKRIGELTVNVQILPEIIVDENGGSYICLTVSRSPGVASTSDGRYFLRIGDTCSPIVGDAVLRLADERPATPWEMMTALGVVRDSADPTKVNELVSKIRASDRVKASVKQKSNDELLDHYGLMTSGLLTNLGLLLLGRASDRAKLGVAPIVQAIKYDEQGVKVHKIVWDDNTLSPLELLDAVWSSIPDFRESYELPEGMLRTTIPAFDEVVVRELLVNAFVHRPYTQRGDIFLNLHPDRLEVVNPGRLPLGVTSRNILHSSRRRNDALARVFHDLKLMEREGSGFDLMYERLLTSGRSAPTAREGTDSVHVTIPRRVMRPEVIAFISEVDRQYQLTQRERIALALLAQGDGLSAVEFARSLELGDDSVSLRGWIDRLVDLGLVQRTGRTSAMRYFVPPDLLRRAGLDRRTTLTRIQPHRLRALIIEDLERYPESSISEIQRRIGQEISLRTLRRSLKSMEEAGDLMKAGERRWSRYRLQKSIDRQGSDGQ
ncbi:ATP-binding protein [Bdellovibrionota bacterium FG-1]